jgi:RNA polymerase sigma-70 factor (ECF subfamily)
VNDESRRLAEHLFRHQAGRIVSSLVRVLGVAHIALAEDAVQDALVRALETWKFGSAPDNPAAWLTRAAKNRALDLLKHDSRAGRLLPAQAETFEAAPAEAAAHAIQDDELRLMFSCCDPGISRPAQVAIVLKYLGGFSVEEIAQALLSSEAAIEKQLFRARRILSDRGELFEVHDPDQVRERIPAVHEAIYLLFNEGYHGAHPEEVVREDLCHEAIRLGLMLTHLPTASVPETQALLALFCFLAARLPGRMDDDGNLLLLAEQDREKWDRELVEEGFRRLDASAVGDALTARHLEAAIAARHASARSFAETEWGSILELYDLLLLLSPSPVVELNRAVALGMAEGPEAGMRALAEITVRERLRRYPFFPAAMAEFERRAGRPQRAAELLEAALRLARNPIERELFARKLAACRAQASGEKPDGGGAPPLSGG